MFILRLIFGYRSCGTKEKVTLAQNTRIKKQMQIQNETVAHLVETSDAHINEMWFKSY